MVDANAHDACNGIGMRRGRGSEMNYNRTLVMRKRKPFEGKMHFGNYYYNEETARKSAIAEKTTYVVYVAIEEWDKDGKRKRLGE